MIFRISDHSRMPQEEIEHMSFIENKFHQFCDNEPFSRDKAISQDLFEKQDKSKLWNIRSVCTYL